MEHELRHGGMLPDVLEGRMLRKGTSGKEESNSTDRRLIRKEELGYIHI